MRKLDMCGDDAIKRHTHYMEIGTISMDSKVVLHPTLTHITMQDAIPTSFVWHHKLTDTTVLISNGEALCYCCITTGSAIGAPHMGRYIDGFLENI